MKRISVVIPTMCCREHFLKRAIKSVLNQTYPIHEIVIIGDKDIELPEWAKRDDRIIFTTQQGRGVSNARNKGIEISTGDYIAFLDDDDWWKRDKLEKQVKLVDTYGLVYSNIIIVTENNLRYNGQERIFCGQNLFRKLLERNFIPASTVLVKKKVVERLGGFDESLHFAEDYDLWLRISKRYSICGIDEPLVFYTRPSKQKFAKYGCLWCHLIEKWRKEYNVNHWMLYSLWYLKEGGRLTLTKYWYHKLRLMIKPDFRYYTKIIKEICGDTI